MEPLKVKVINHSPYPLPAYESAHAAGLDLRAWLDAPVTLGPLERAVVPTGLHFEVPPGYEAQVRPRSGLAARHGLTVLNSPGTVDADYRGEVRVVLVNLSQEPYTVEPGERVAQVVFAAHARVDWEAVEALSETARGAGGFGSTGRT